MDPFSFHGLVESRKRRPKKGRPATAEQARRFGLMMSGEGVPTRRLRNVAILEIPQGSPTFDEVLEGHIGQLDQLALRDIGMD